MSIITEVRHGQCPHADLPANWRTRIIRDPFDLRHELPAWVDKAYEEYRAQVSHPNYPCYFGHLAEMKGEILYAFADGLDPTALIRIMREFVRRTGTPRFARSNLAVFFRPLLGSDCHERFTARFWRLLELLHDGGTAQGGPDDPNWEFEFEGCQMFVVGGNRTYRNRRSRNLGEAQVMLFQPRTVFLDEVTNQAIGIQARRAIRGRLAKWDHISHHPDLGVYGEPENREWKQYCLPDDNLPTTAICPMRGSSRQASETVHRKPLNIASDRYPA